jgi:uncharacterized repeat protein (TIGR03803 family)
MKKLGLVKMLCMVAALFVATSIPSPAQTFTSLASFDGYDGQSPNGVIQGPNGNFYGTATFGIDILTAGTVFEVTPTGAITALHGFYCTNTSCPNGGLPNGGLSLGSSGNFFGLTGSGGANGFGTAFEITPAGKFETIWSFCALEYCADGDYASSLMAAANGNLFGTTSGGGAYQHGTVFELVPGGSLTTLYSFCSGINSGNCYDGENPNAALTLASNGNFYGTTYEGGLYGYEGGTIFEITPAGELTTLYSFCAKANCADGASPNGVIQAAAGNFYGVTYEGGIGSCSDGAGCGTVYEMTPTGTLTTLYTFCRDTNCPDGWGPSSVMQATDGNFYGTTNLGGANGEGTIFEITPAGKLTTLYSFCSEAYCGDGEIPAGGLLQATNGTFYGTTIGGGSSSGCDFGCGTVFSLATGLAPFVKTIPTAGKAGTSVIVLGNDLTGATSVSFNSKAATFTVVSDTEITATVPAGATTGTVDVAIPGSTLKSNVAFRVMK